VVQAAAVKTSRTAPAVHAGSAPAALPSRSKPLIEGITATKIDASGSSTVKQPERAPTPVPPQTSVLKQAANKTRNPPVEQPLAMAPTKHFRRRQANLARHLFEDSEKPTPAASKAPDMPSLNGFPTSPGDPFRATQVAKTEHAHPNQKNTQQCPNCTAEVPAPAERCRCGYELPNISLFPEIELTAEDHAITGIIGNSLRRT